MTDRMFIISQRLKLLLVSLGVVALIAPGASAALKKYKVNRRTLTQYEGVSPSIEYISGNVEPFLGVGLIDESGPEPILQKLIMVTGGGGGRLTAGRSRQDSNQRPLEGKSGYRARK